MSAKMSVVALKKMVSELATETEQKTVKKAKVFSDVEVMSSVETNRILLPEGMNPSEARHWLEEWEEQQESEVEISATINSYPLEGALAMAKVFKEVFGWTSLIPTPGFFSKKPPALVSIEIGPGVRTSVHWGRYQIPGLEGGWLATGVANTDGRMVFQLGGIVKRKFEGLVRGLITAIEQRVYDESIYRGQALRLELRDKSGNLKQWQPADCPSFIDTTDIVEDELVFPEVTQFLVDSAVFTPIEQTKECRKHRVPLKRGVMLEGPYGVGKTLCANVIAKKCVQNGWTFLYITDARDVDQALQLAQQYQPAVVFCEDIDRFVGTDRTTDIDRLLNILDGVGTKNTEIITVLTTNAVQDIHKALIRPGRIDTIVPVRPPDGPAAARLVTNYGRGMVKAKEVDLIAALQPLLDMGGNAAIYREVVERAKLVAIRRIAKEGGKGEKIVIEAVDISIAARTMYEHLQLLSNKQNTEVHPAVAFVNNLEDNLSAKMHDDVTDIVTQKIKEFEERHF